MQSEEPRAGRLVKRHPLVIVGAGPIGLTAALDCAQPRHPSLLLDDNNTVSSARAPCATPSVRWRSGTVSVSASAMVAKGVSWKVGKVFFHDDWSTSFDLLPEAGHKMPAMINLQQYYLEEFLVEACKKSRSSTCAGSTS